MSDTTTETRFLKDFAGRRFTAVAVVAACLASASLNTWGGTMMFPNWVTSIVFGVMIACGEFIAATALRHIVADFENHRYWKARLGAVILALAITGCVLSGHKAFTSLYLEAEHAYRVQQKVAETSQKIADKYQAKHIANDTDDTIRAQYESRQNTANYQAMLALKAKPPHKGIMYVLLALFEVVKIGGLYALASPSTKGKTWPQRRAEKRQQKIRDKKAIVEFERKIAELDDADDNVLPMRA